VSIAASAEMGHSQFGDESRERPTAGWRCDGFGGQFMVPNPVTIVRGAALQKRPPVTPKARRSYRRTFGATRRSGARAAACRYALIPHGVRRWASAQGHSTPLAFQSPPAWRACSIPCNLCQVANTSQVAPLTPCPATG
jgi:hypothetical protein